MFRYISSRFSRCTSHLAYCHYSLYIPRHCIVIFSFHDYAWKSLYCFFFSFHFIPIRHSLHYLFSKEASLHFIFIEFIPPLPPSHVHSSLQHLIIFNFFSYLHFSWSFMPSSSDLHCSSCLFLHYTVVSLLLFKWFRNAPIFVSTLILYYFIDHQLILFSPTSPLSYIYLNWHPFASKCRSFVGCFYFCVFFHRSPTGFVNVSVLPSFPRRVFALDFIFHNLKMFRSYRLRIICSLYSLSASRFINLSREQVFLILFPLQFLTTFLFNAWKWSLVSSCCYFFLPTFFHRASNHLPTMSLFLLLFPPVILFA